MSLVRYYPADTFFHKLDPRVKVIWLFCVFILSLAFNHPLYLSVLLLSVFLLWIFLKIPFSEIGLFFKALFFVAIATFILQLLFYPGKSILIALSLPTWIPYFGGIIAITVEGLVNGISMVLRLFTIVLSMPLVTMTTPVEKLIIGLIKMGMPYEIAFAATTALNMLPVLQSDAQKIIDAQKARAFTALEKGGIKERIKAYIPLIVPLMVSSFKKGRQLEIAMESRAFGAYEGRSYLIEIKMNRLDKVLSVFFLCFTILCLFMRTLFGFGAFNP